MATEQRVPDLMLDYEYVDREVRIDSLRIDRSYQRDPSQRLVDDIANDWSSIAAELVIVSDRGERDDGNGGLWLVNGQHRSLAARKLGRETIAARIFDLSAVEDPAAVEAELRLQLNVKLADRPLERFKAQLRAGDEDSLNIVKILARFDTQINQVPSKDSGINAISTVEALYMEDKGGLLSEIIETLRDAFATSPTSGQRGTLGGAAVGAGMMKAVGWFIEKHASETDRTRLIDKMQKAGTTGLYTRAVNIRAAMGGSTWKNYYRTLIEIYNDGLRETSKIKWVDRGSGSFASRTKWGQTSSAWGGKTGGE